MVAFKEPRHSHYPSPSFRQVTHDGHAGAFFSSTHHDQEQLFFDLNVWQEEETRKVAGKYPVISLSFADCKGATYAEARAQIINELIGLLDKKSFLKGSPKLSDQKRTFFAKFNQESSNADAQYFLKWLCEALEMHYAIKPIVLLDEYDTPLLSAWLNGFWDNLVKFMQPLMGLTFKNNKSLTRGLMFGITRVSKESIFSALNNQNVITTTSQKYATGFGFTEKEVFAAMDEYGLTDKAGVKTWYDGFTFGNTTDIYNPWSWNPTENSTFIGPTPLPTNSSADSFKKGAVKSKPSWKLRSKADQLK